MSDDRTVDEQSQRADEVMSGGWAAAFIAGEQVDLTPLRAEKRRLADAIRRATETLVSADLPLDEVARAADDLEAVVERFEALPAAEYEGFGEMANAPRAEGFFDRSPILGRANPISPPLVMLRGDEQIVATATFGSAYEGPPGCVHGGWIAASFDEVLGAAQSLSGTGGMTAFLHVNYRSPTPLHTEVRFEGDFERREGRKVFTRGRLLHGDRLCADAEALFIAVDAERFAQMERERRSRPRPQP
jgi:acyl-coenzyme A thioesterase PaaI-like protein